MSLLPQRRKSAEEPHQLREQLGIQPQYPEDGPEQPVDSPAAPPPAPEPETFPVPTLKPVRSLRRTERDTPVARGTARGTSFSKIPARRHAPHEIQEIRRRDALSRFSGEEHPIPFPLPAPRWLTIPSYLFALFGFACHYWTQIPLYATAGAAGVALLVSLYLLLRRPLSRHHAGFLASITLLSLVFAALHYFPHLRHAS